jgi:hypothetical protein
MKKIVTFTAALFIAATLIGQAPASFKYQAVLRDARGNIKANTATNIIIGILQGSATGAAVYSEIHSVTTDSYGLINLELGKGTATIGAISAINWGTDTYFVKVTVDGVDMGTSQLLSVPYALYAAKVANAFSGSYNDLTNKPTLFDGTWTNLSDKPKTLDGYGITDAIKTSHPANGILSTNITNWNAAYSWGNHAGLYKPIGYIPSWSEISSNPFSITNPSNYQLLRYNAGLSKWENWTANYITGYIETDPVFIAWNKSAGISITNTQISNWSTATSSFLTGITSGQVTTALGFTPYNSTNPSGYTSNTGTVTSVAMSAPVGLTIAGTPVTTSGTLVLTLTSGYAIPTTDQLFPGFGTTGDKAAYGNHTHSDATIVASGFMSEADKTKLDGLDKTYIDPGTNITVEGDGTSGHHYVINATSHEIGEEYGGGIVFFVYDGGQHGLIAAKEDLLGGQYIEPDLPWFYLSCEECNIESGAKGDGLGAGAMNTTLIVASQASYSLYYSLGFPMQDFAAKVCADYETIDGDFTIGDWYLPSKYELNLLFNQKNIIALNLLGGYCYWSSTEIDKYGAWYQSFSNGTPGNGSKYQYNMTAHVRPIRAF